MGEKFNVRFLDKDYSFPADVLTYIGEHHFFETMRQDMLSFMLSNFADPDNFPTNIETVFENQTKKLADICIKKVLEQGIYNVTTEDFLADNKGVPMFDKAWRGEAKEQCEALLQQITGFVEGAQRAEAIRDSQITGTGLTVLTNNIIGFGVWAAMENHELKKQSAKADAQFRATVEQIESQGKSKTNSHIANYRAKVYLPQIKECADTIVIALFEKYIRILIDNGKFDETALNYNDTVRAESLLKNINSVSNKTILLHTAFEQCPYYSPIYITAIKSGENIDEIMPAANLFDITETLSDYLRENCEKLVLDKTKTESVIIANIMPCLIVLSKINNSTIEEETNKTLLKRRYDLSKEMKILSTMAYNSREFDTLIRKLISKDVIQVIDTPVKNIREILQSYIDTNILFGDNSDYYDRKKAQTIDTLQDKVNLYIDEAKRRYEKYQQVKNAFTKFKTNTDKEIAKCEKELQALGFFSISKRSTLRQRLIVLKDSLSAEESKVNVAKQEFNNMYQQ